MSNTRNKINKYLFGRIIKKIFEFSKLTQISMFFIFLLFYLLIYIYYLRNMKKYRMFWEHKYFFFLSMIAVTGVLILFVVVAFYDQFYLKSFTKDLNF